MLYYVQIKQRKKTTKDNSQWDPNAQLTNHRPCDACSWYEDTQSTGNKYCKGKDRYDCVSTTEETTCNDKAGCEWYIDSMDAYPRDTEDGTVDPFEPFQFFTCDNISGRETVLLTRYVMLKQMIQKTGVKKTGVNGNVHF